MRIDDELSWRVRMRRARLRYGESGAVTQIGDK